MGEVYKLYQREDAAASGPWEGEAAGFRCILETGDPKKILHRLNQSRGVFALSDLGKTMYVLMPDGTRLPWSDFEYRFTPHTQHEESP